MAGKLSKNDIQALVSGTQWDPMSFLGLHEVQGGIVVRSLQLFADSVHVLNLEDNRTHPMKKVHPNGLFEVKIPDAKPFAYRLRVKEGDQVKEQEDPYRFPPQISDFDLYLFGEGTHFRTYEHMGAHMKTIDGVQGCHFAVWAPNAKRVSVTGEFNRWDGRHHPMQGRGSSGLWELFIPGLNPGDLYKFEILGPDGYLFQKADPYSFASELRPRTASVIWDNHAYSWSDGDWMQSRREKDWLKEPINVYELHPGSWRRVPEDGNRWLTYREMAEQLIPYVKDMGYTHIELLPITEHPYDGSWGYQTIGYFAPTSRFGSPDDLKAFIDRCHEEGIAVILDWVPAHFPKDGHGLCYFDGTHLYEHADPRQGEHRDWGTLIFNYGRNEVRTFLLSSAMYWADVFHVDGIRVDAVASMLYLDYSREDGDWIPNKYGGRENLEAIDFLKTFNRTIHEEYPGFTTYAEESTAWPMVSRPVYLGGLGFDFKWNMGWMNDTLQYISKDPVHRKYHHNNLTFSLLYAFNENFILPFSHDEIVHGKRSMLDKMPGDDWQKFANLRLLYAYMTAHPGKKLLFMGGEIGQWHEWDHHASVQWHLLQYGSHLSLQNCVRDLNRIYRAYPAFYTIDFSWEGFEWIEYHDSEQSTLAFMRKSEVPDEEVVCLFNFTPIAREGYRVGMPAVGDYAEILNTDAEIYGGAGVGNSGCVTAEAQPWQSQPCSAVVRIPPLGAVFFKRRV